MTDLLLAGILITLLLQIHVREKNMGWYGHVYVILKKRALRYLIRQAKVYCQKATDFIREKYKRSKDTGILSGRSR